MGVARSRAKGHVNWPVGMAQNAISPVSAANVGMSLF